jgi:hypothetical protein
MKRKIISILAAALAMFCLAGLYTGVLARSYIAEHVDPVLLRASPNMALVFLGYLVLACVMVLLYRRFAQPARSPASNGLRFGCLMAVCWLVPYSLVLFGVYRFPYGALPLDFAWAFVEQGLGGLVVGLILGRTVQPTAFASPLRVPVAVSAA